MIGIAVADKEEKKMTPYEEMAKVATDARAKWFKRRDAVLQFLHRFYLGLNEYCQMPEGAMRHMPWNEEAQVFLLDADAKTRYIVPPMHYIEERDEWGMGVFIRLSPAGNFPPLYVTFVVFADESDSNFVVRIGPGKERTINFDDKDAFEVCFAEIVTGIKSDFSETQGQRSSKLGFHYGTEATLS